jgi:hypothetical protein
MKLKQVNPNCFIFTDKNGNIIKEGDELRTNLSEYFKNTVIVKNDYNELCLIFKHGNVLIPLNTLFDSFFDNCEIIK